MDLLCHTEAIDDETGDKVMKFTKGRTYYGYRNYDPNGYAVLDDTNAPQIFFRLDVMFSVAKRKIPIRPPSDDIDEPDVDYRGFSAPWM